MTTEWRDPEDREGLEAFEDVLLALKLHSGGVTYDVGYWTGAYWRCHLHKEVIGW